VAEVDDVVDGAVDDLQEVVDADQNGEPLKRLTRKLVYAHMQHACMWRKTKTSQQGVPRSFVAVQINDVDIDIVGTNF
jgi:hypothetical protein